MSEAAKLPLSGDELQQMLDNSPFIAFLGLKVTEADPAKERVTMECEMRPEFERGKGTGQWHGGPIAAIIDTVGDYALIMALRRGLPTINFRVDYLRPAIKTRLITTAHGPPQRQERRRRRCRCLQRQDGVARRRPRDVLDAGGLILSLSVLFFSSGSSPLAGEESEEEEAKRQNGSCFNRVEAKGLMANVTRRIFGAGALATSLAAAPSSRLWRRASRSGAARWSRPGAAANRRPATCHPAAVRARPSPRRSCSSGWPNGR